MKAKIKRRRRRSSQKGFILLGVILVVAVLVAAVTLTLTGSSESLKETTSVKSAEISQAALNEGMSRALAQLGTMDPAVLYSGTPANNDIFTWDPVNPPVDFIDDGVAPAGFPYPPTGPYAGDVMVRVGMRPGQRTQAPAGEDVRNTYGYIIEVQLSAEMTGFGTQAEERVAVGIQIPHEYSHSK